MLNMRHWNCIGLSERGKKEMFALVLIVVAMCIYSARIVVMNMRARCFFFLPKCNLPHALTYVYSCGCLRCK
jgi:hypothetical protein